MRVVESLNQALHRLMREDPHVYLLGEDILDPYGGAFKVAKGLSTQYPGRVLTSPISEAALVGVACGMAMHGKRPIVELMFGDFLMLAADQIVNHAVKFGWMYNHNVSVPLILRTPMGGRRGYGPTHSQSLEKHFCGVPGLTVYAVNQYSDPGELLARAYQQASPVLFIENKVLYARTLAELPACASPDVAIVTYGGCVEHAVAAAEHLHKHDEIAVRIVALTQLSPFPAEQVLRETRDVARVLVVEEGTAGWNLASEVARHLIGRPLTFHSLAAPAHPIPSSLKWEQQILPDQSAIVAAVMEMLETSFEF